MSLAAQGRGLFVLPVGGLGILGCRTLGCPGSQGGVFHSFPLPSSFIFNTGPLSELLPVLHQGVGSLCGGSRFTVQGGNRTSVFRAWLLLPLICNAEGHGWLGASHRSFSPQPLFRLSPFRMETAQSVLQSLRLGDWMVSLDLQDAHLQVPVHPDSRRYLRFCIGRHTFQFRALCFGLSSALQVFTCVMAPISSIMHRHGFQILRYLDD